ncbi:MAG: GC-type dockerin domain-anchored protein [Phycisphaerales bacterium]
MVGAPDALSHLFNWSSNHDPQLHRHRHPLRRRSRCSGRRNHQLLVRQRHRAGRRPALGANGKSYFNIEGPGQADAFESFGVLDYGTDGLGLSFAKPFDGEVSDITAMSIDLTEGFPPSSWYRTGTLKFYVVTDTATSIQPGSTLHCIVGAEDQCGDQLGAKYLLGSGLYDVGWGNGAERHNLALNTVDPAGKQIIIDALNSGTPFRILVQGVADVGAGLEGQYTFNSIYLAPMLHLDVVEAELPPACPGDVGIQGGGGGQDGQLDNNDFIAFISYFFEQNAIADMGVQGGVPGHDGAFDNNDFIAFISNFFAGCNG